MYNLMGKGPMNKYGSDNVSTKVGTVDRGVNSIPRWMDQEAGKRMERRNQEIYLNKCPN